MEEIKLTGSIGAAPITEADLHAYVDQQLTAARRIDIEQFLASHLDER